jgi:hypothetical protein
MTASRGTNKTGADVYLALANLLQLLGEDGAGLLDERTLAALPGELAYISDFTLEARNHLSAKLFTAHAVGTIFVRACQGEEIILLKADPVHGLAVRLHNSLSPSLEAMLVQFCDCMAAVTLTRIAETLPARSTGWRLTGQRNNVHYVCFS